MDCMSKQVNALRKSSQDLDLIPVSCVGDCKQLMIQVKAHVSVMCFLYCKCFEWEIGQLHLFQDILCFFFYCHSFFVYPTKLYCRAISALSTSSD